MTTPDGARLDGLFLPAAPHTGPGLPVVLTHGYLETKELHHAEAILLSDHGHDVLMFDLRAHGRSGGWITSLGVWEPADVTAVIDQATRQGLIHGRVITMGYSTGAAVVIQHAATDPRVAGVVALAPFADLPAAIRSFRRHYGRWLDEACLLDAFDRVARRVGFDIAQSSALRAIGHLAVPMLLAYGGCDKHLPPPDHACLLASKAPPGLCQLVRVPGAGHLSIYRRHWPRLAPTVVRFCQALA